MMNRTREVTKTDAGREWQTGLLTKEVTRLNRSLPMQVNLFDGLQETADEETAKHELENLDRIFAELSSASHRLCGLVPEEYVHQINSTLNENGENVERIGKAVQDWLQTKRKMSTQRVVPSSR